MSSRNLRKSKSNSNLAAKCKEIRKLHRLSQSEFGKTIAASYAQVSAWERSVSPIPKWACLNICREFQVSEDALLGKGNSSPIITEPPESYGRLGRKEKKLLKEIENLLESGDQAIKADLSRHIQMLSAWADRRKKT